MFSRIFNGFAALMLLGFCCVQMNDPDGVYWAVVYAGAMLWCAIAAIRPRLLLRSTARVLFMFSLVIAGFLVVYYWPREPGWWRQEVWWNIEPVREGMGLMLTFLLLLGVLLARRTAERSRSLSVGAND